jgi:hypothetical protein
MWDIETVLKTLSSSFIGEKKMNMIVAQMNKTSVCGGI